MNFLLFFISSIFSAIFYIFYKIKLGEKVFLGGEEHFVGISSISGNLFFESIVFLLLGVFLFFCFSNFSFLYKHKPEIEKEEEGYGIKNNFFKDFNFTTFFKKYLYYIGFIFFYFAIYFILQSLGISDFSYFIFLLNVVIGILFFLTSRAELFRDFIKVNTILFSLYYIFIYLYILFLGSESIVWIDIINSFFLFSYFLINFYSDSKILKRKETDSVLVLYFFIYIFVVVSFYIKQLFQAFNLEFIYGIMFVGLIFNIIIYFIFQKITFLKSSKYILRILSFLFIYITIILGIFLLCKEKNIISFYTTSIIVILLYGIYFNYQIHKKYQNYISYLFSFISACFILYYLVFYYCSSAGIEFLKWEIIVTFFISLSLVVYTYIYKLRYNADYYFLHICAYIVNLLGVIYYFYHVDFTILDFGIILLLDSILIFLSYFKLKRIILD